MKEKKLFKYLIRKVELIQQPVQPTKKDILIKQEQDEYV
jgi:hypothetical protein